MLASIRSFATLVRESDQDDILNIPEITFIQVKLAGRYFTLIHSGRAQQC